MAARIALLLPKLSSYGGVERFGLDLAGILALEGFEVDFICARQETEAPQGVRVLRLGRTGPLKSLKMLWFALAAERVRRRNRYDLSIGLGKTLRQDVLRIGGGPLANFQRLSSRAYAPGAARAWKGIRRAFSPANALTRWIEPRQLRRAKVVVAVSHLVRDWLLQAHPWLEPEKVRLIYNRPDPARFHPPDPALREAERGRLGLSPGDVALTTAGANFRLKNLAGLIRALPLLPENFRLLVAGGRNSARYARLAGELGVAGRVRFLGKVADMPAFYAASDVFALPTFYDACSNAVLEALACGVRTLSTRDNGSSFFLPPSRILDDPLDVKSLARLLEQTASEPPPGPLAWPSGVDCGLTAYLALIRELLDASLPRP